MTGLVKRRAQMFHLSDFLIYCFITAYTPGANNLLSMSNAARLGFRDVYKRQAPGMERHGKCPQASGYRWLRKKTGTLTHCMKRQTRRFTAPNRKGRMVIRLIRNLSGPVN